MTPKPLHPSDCADHLTCRCESSREDPDIAALGFEESHEIAEGVVESPLEFCQANLLAAGLMVRWGDELHHFFGIGGPHQLGFQTDDTAVNANNNCFTDHELKFVDRVRC